MRSGEASAHRLVNRPPRAQALEPLLVLSKSTPVAIRACSRPIVIPAFASRCSANGVDEAFAKAAQAGWRFAVNVLAVVASIHPCIRLYFTSAHLFLLLSLLLRTKRRTPLVKPHFFPCSLMYVRPLAGVLKHFINPGSLGFFSVPRHARTRSNTLGPDQRRTSRRTLDPRRTSL